MVEELQISQFDYNLPKHLIAQEPARERDAARLLVLRRPNGEFHHRHVRDLPELLSPGDLLVLNNTKVLPARLRGRRASTGGKWEGLFLRQMADGAWELLCQTRGLLRAGETIVVGASIPACPAQARTLMPTELRLRLLAKTVEGHWLVEPSERGSPEHILERYGETPLPPYIRKGHEKAGDRDRYQTVFAERFGSVAAPTAALHFTAELLRRLTERGIAQAFVTLHVGSGTFQPIQMAKVAEHQMHTEWCELPKETAGAIKACRSRGGKVVAIGTTAVRVLETAAREGQIAPWSGETNLFIHPPFTFRVVDALLTNFHLPRSSLLVLVSAFAGMDPIRLAYQVAISNEYRFYSYGDAMLIL